VTELNIEAQREYERTLEAGPAAHARVGVTGAPETTGGPVRPIVALALATVSFIALVIFGLGMVSLAVGADIIEARGLGQIPGIVATALATAAFALSLWLTLRRGHPSFWGALWAALACYAVYVGDVDRGAVGRSGPRRCDRGRGTHRDDVVRRRRRGVRRRRRMGRIALVRTRAQRPRWPWEDEFDE
jgi:hypothetical protein